MKGDKMRDSLKEHIDSNTEKFDIFPFEGGDWSEVAEKLGPIKKKKMTGWILGIAASLAIVFVSSVLVISNTKSAPPNEVAEIEGYYQEEINQKISLVMNKIGDDKILQDLQAMDEAFAELKTDLNENVDNEEVVMAMMDNYRLKLEILEKILTELEKEKQ